MNVARAVRTHGTTRKYDQANLIAHGVDGARLLTMGEAEFRAVAGAGVLRRRSM
jgi:aryl carrier-like protein